MQASHAGLIRGLSITTVVISLLCILLLGALLAFIGLAGAMMDNPDARSQLTYELVLNPDEIQTLESLGIPADDPAILAEWIIQTLGDVADVLMVAHIVALVAGVMAMRNSADVAKLGSVFGWGIAGAVASLIGSNYVIMVLLIIVAVFAYMDCKAAPQA